MEKKPVLIGCHTYGYYYPNEKSFTCTHGGWSTKMDINDDGTCNLHGVRSHLEFEFIDKIPEDYIR